jgi:hypothetical protein
LTVNDQSAPANKQFVREGAEQPWIGYPGCSVTFKACQKAMSLHHHIYMGIICHGGEASC